MGKLTLGSSDEMINCGGITCQRGDFSEGGVERFLEIMACTECGLQKMAGKR